MDTDTANLASDDIYRGAIAALTKWRMQGRYQGDWRDYRESAVAWLKEATARLEAVE